MTDTTDDLIRSCFDEALALTPEQREKYLRDEIGDETMRREVRALLKSYEEAEDYLEHPPTASGVSVDEIAKWANPDAQLVGETIGSCRLTRVIASGGMGTVYEAEQEEPKRRVAVKLMRRRLQSRHARRRFEYETQILARLRHPGIAQILEAGTQDGEPLDVPYFVMEYIEDARALTDYAREQDLSLRRRIELFIEICEAVHHGHLRGVIHRDLKPENILIDREGRSRIIDFGVAKATNQDLAISTFITETGQLVGTLQYMSPEQCDGETGEIDLQSDVYSLGVILYELLCDELPYELTSAKPVEALRIVREQNPPRPSDTNRMLRGDLDTIVLKTLAKEPERRYESAVELAADLQRYLDSEPIAARPPSAIYQMRKFTQRNRTLVGSAAIIIVLLVTGIISTSVGWNRAARAETVSAQAESEASRELTRANEVTRIIKEMLSSVDPVHARGTDITLLKHILDGTAQRLESGEIKDQLIAAALHAIIGRVYSSLRQHVEAEQHLPVALAIRKQSLGEEHFDTITSMNDLASLYTNEGRYNEAESLYLKTLAFSKRVKGEEHLHTLDYMNNLAMLYSTYGEGWYANAEPLFLKLLEIQKRRLGEEDSGTLATMNNLGLLYANQGRISDAESLLTKTLEIQKRVLGTEHRSTLGTMTNLGKVYPSLGRYEEATALLSESLQIMRRVLNPHDIYLDATLNNLVGVYHWMRVSWPRHQAEYLIEHAQHTEASVYVLNQAAMELLTHEDEELHDFDLALTLAKRCCAKHESELGELPELAWTLDTLAIAYFQTGDLQRAVETQRRAVKLAPDDPYYAPLLAKYEAALSEDAAIASTP